MEKVVKVSYPLNKRMDIDIDGFTIKADQRVEAGGEGSAPTPFALFLASIGSCAGVYAKKFCDSREIDTKGMSLDLRAIHSAEDGRYTKMIINLHLPPGFPDKYKGSIIKAMELCDVKKHLSHPPDFEIIAS